MINQKCAIAVAACLLMSCSVASAVDGAALAKSSQCMSCHAVDSKLVGPAFSAVAAKYRGNAAGGDTLATSIKLGSTGKWGPMAMPANQRLSDADLHTLTDWILSQ